MMLWNGWWLAPWMGNSYPAEQRAKREAERDRQFPPENYSRPTCEDAEAWKRDFPEEDECA